MNKEFTDVELDLIYEYTDKNKGTLLKSKRKDCDFIIIDSPTSYTSITVVLEYNKRLIKVCLSEFKEYNPYKCNNPSDLKKALLP